MTDQVMFSHLGLDERILQALKSKGYEHPTPIQEQAIPVVLKGSDLMAAAQTGTGKTAGFTLPILELLIKSKPVKRNEAKVLILTPTRELAAQISDNICEYGKNLGLTYAVVFGGVSINAQKVKLKRGVDILVATPGRLLDLHQQRAITFTNLEILVLDEADRMLDMGFIHDIKKIISRLPVKRQNLMFSATFSDEIKKLAKTLMNNPVEVSIGVKNSAIEVIDQWLVSVDQKQKTNLLIHLIKEKKWRQLLVFIKTKHGANRLVKKLEARGLRAAAIHGNKSQAARTKALNGFKEGSVNILVATDIAARGIDINLLPMVVNYDLPKVAEDYVHRIGRTARAGAEGEAVSLVSCEELKELKSIERLIKKLIDRKEVPGFKPSEPLPVLKLDTRPIKPKRPKKNVMKSKSK